MAYEFRLPDLGEGVQEGEIVRWLVKEGDVVAADQPVVEVMTDKVTAELPIPVGGTVTHLAGAAGDILHVGEVLIEVEPHPTAEVPQPPLREMMEPSPELLDDGVEPAAAETAAAGRPIAVPAVRRRAREMGIDLSTVTGTGPGGRIVDADLQPGGGGGAPAAREPVAPVGPAGARKPSQEPTSTSGTPASASVGTSGNSGVRLVSVTASGRRAPAEI